MWVWFYLFFQLTAATDRINSLCEEQHTLKQENEVILQSSQRKEEVRSVFLVLIYFICSPFCMQSIGSESMFLTLSCGLIPGDSPGQPSWAGDIQTEPPGPGWNVQRCVDTVQGREAHSAGPIPYAKLQHLTTGLPFYKMWKPNE